MAFQVQAPTTSEKHNLRCSPLVELIMLAAAAEQFEVACNLDVWAALDWEAKDALFAFQVKAPAAAIRVLSTLPEKAVMSVAEFCEPSATELLQFIIDTQPKYAVKAVAARRDLPRALAVSAAQRFAVLAPPAVHPDRFAGEAWEKLGGSSDPNDPAAVSDDELVQRLTFAMLWRGVTVLGASWGVERAQLAPLVLAAVPLARVHGQVAARLAPVLEAAVRFSRLPQVTKKLVSCTDETTPVEALSCVLRGLAAKRTARSGFSGDGVFLDPRARSTLRDVSFMDAALALGGDLAIAALRTEGCPQSALLAAATSGDRKSMLAVLCNASTPTWLFSTVLDSITDIPANDLVSVIAAAAEHGVLGRLAAAQPLVWSHAVDDPALAKILCADTNAVQGALSCAFFNESDPLGDAGAEFEMVAGLRPDLLDDVCQAIRPIDLVHGHLATLVNERVLFVLGEDPRCFQVFAKLCAPERPLLVSAQLAAAVVYGPSTELVS